MPELIPGNEFDKKNELSEAEIKTLELEKKVYKARKCNTEFERLVNLCEEGISDWIDKVNTKNDMPTHTPKLPTHPSNLRIRKIVIPLICISPNETVILITYLNNKYIKNNKVGGDYFCLKKRLFTQELCLSTKYSHF